MPYIPDNEGVGGGPFLTMTILDVADQSFGQDDLEAGKTACVVTGNNEVGKGSAGKRLFGKVVWVSTETLEGSTVPATCAVQARGVARFTTSSPTPQVNQMVEVAGDGTVRQASASADLPAGGPPVKGQVIAVDTANNTCDVWLG